MQALLEETQVEIFDVSIEEPILSMTDHTHTFVDADYEEEA